MTELPQEPQMAYQRIAPFPADAAQMASTELKALATVWLERREELQDTGVFQDLLKKMQREWAIETGIIERLYTWDRGVTEVLIEQGIDAGVIAHQSGMQRDQADQVQHIIQDQLDIVEGLFAFVKGEQPLTEHFIRGLQAQFTAHQDHTEAMTPDGQITRVSLLRGEYKKLPNNPRRPDGSIHHYCPPELVAEEMPRLVEWYRAREAELAPEVRAAWLHHRFTQIHPFQDGNGRVARALASLVLLRAHLFPLVVRDADRRDYIAALEAADAGDLKPLVDLFARRQRDAILRALGLEQQVQQDRHAEQIIASALQVLKGKYHAARGKLDAVYDHAGALFELAAGRMQDIADALNEQLRAVTPPQHAPYDAAFGTARNDPEKRQYFYTQIVDIAKRHGYDPHPDRWHGWLRITITTEERFEIVVSIHGYGPRDSGIMAASAFTERRIEKEGGSTDFVDVKPASIDLFELNYAESRGSTAERFSEWLESALAIALAKWQRLVSDT